MPVRTFILGTAGHIDHGKTTLVRALTGIDTDRLPEEKSRGITIDIGFASLDIGEVHIGIVDVPGHERFIRNMLAGATGIDLAMLIVAADDGVMPQTREHLAILRLLNVERGVVALTKTDLVEESWVDLVEDDLRQFLRGSFLQDAPIVRVSAVRGQGIDELREAIKAECERLKARGDGELFRLAVDRSFHAPGVGTIVTGSVARGRLRAGEEVEWLPVGKPVRIRGLQTHGRDVPEVSRGERAAVNLIGVNHSDIMRGHELATPGWLAPSRLLTVHLRLLDDAPWPLRHRARVRLHIGTQEVIAAARLIGANEVQPGGEGFAQLVTAEPAVAHAGEPLVIRAESPLLTLGGGHVLQPAARPLRRREARELSGRLDRLRSPDPLIRAGEAVYFFGLRPWTMLQLARDAGVEPSEAADLVKQLLARRELVELAASQGRTVQIHRESVQAIAAKIATALARLHEELPLESQVPRQRLAQRMSRLADPAVVDSIIGELINSNTLRGEGQSVALPSFKPKFTLAQQQLLARMVEIYDKAVFMPPDVGEMSRMVGANEKEVRTILDIAVKAGRVAHLGGPLYMHTTHEQELRRRSEHALRERGGLTMSDLRDLFGTTRKYSVPMGEYLDKVGLTRRQGDVRVLRT